MSSMNRIRLADGREVAAAEWYDQPRFSTCEFAAADPVNLALFNYVPGMPVSKTASIAQRNATDADTNQVKRRAVNQDEALIVFAITYETFALDAEADGSGDVIAPMPALSGTDLRRLQYQAIFELTVGGLKKPQYEVPFAWLCQSIGTKAWSSDAGATSTHIDYGTAGDLTAENQELLELPIYIGGFGRSARPGNSMPFKGRFYNADNGAFTGLRQNVRLRLYLMSLTKRPS
ncbi:MAG: hypothetical protein NUW01_05175 [Gemmatimonadaceae bacterium]|nr:hypothetical protein [Gemmatimonadaceae bacterium]